ncbi:hypothetical protein [Mycoplasmopsis alligatoris]|uniref:Uncharacterized protein n=1 Tax=Mycoplasmopsis alligatoris A21JP2 TaxID=747682 RepID=D4XWJ7_9BACT|nr:hypothetical protein [Mycoplasmopsis alligatoris]EFF41226.1 hypothetical protein MALL_0433 [Mycoplasmopsis alligatoris A21JP2]
MSSTFLLNCVLASSLDNFSNDFSISLIVLVLSVDILFDSFFCFSKFFLISAYSVLLPNISSNLFVSLSVSINLSFTTLIASSFSVFLVFAPSKDWLKVVNNPSSLVSVLSLSKYSALTLSTTAFKAL